MSIPGLEISLPWLVSILGASWVFWQFLLRREAEPGAELELDALFAGRQNDQWLVEVVAILANRGYVRHTYRDFILTVRYFLLTDPIRDGDERIQFQLCCNRTIDERISGSKRRFANVAYIDPRLTFRHSYVTFVPGDATFIWLQCSLRFRAGWKRQWIVKNVQRLLRVPREIF